MVPGLLSQRRKSTQPDRRILAGNHGLLHPMETDCSADDEDLPVDRRLHAGGVLTSLGRHAFDGKGVPLPPWRFAGA
ncbi:hypothetical protein MA16_Dca014024 [Dendrobium catenatum]|uniref:Uncharacterized protein n=1 Tax=Dendrobium catenatum TaxID=906689 RepID=A0A2I0WZS0_9ASPA|nr:hypothetical protein MA16_Dca014024 [Dendrobium catenatum]